MKNTEELKKNHLMILSNTFSNAIIYFEILSITQQFTTNTLIILCHIPCKYAFMCISATKKCIHKLQYWMSVSMTSQ